MIKWYTILIYPANKQKVLLAMNNAAYKIGQEVLPLVPCIKKSKTQSQMIYEGYIFFAIEEEYLNDFLKALYVESDKKILQIIKEAISEDEIDQVYLHAYEIQHGGKTPFSENNKKDISTIASNTEVKIISGPMAGLKCTVKKDEGKELIEIEIKVFDQMVRTKIARIHLS